MKLPLIIIPSLVLASSFNVAAQNEGPDPTDNATDEGGGKVRLESIFVGDKEQPAISYFIPWEGVGTPDNLHWNIEDKHDQALDTVDREIMLRSMELYDDLSMESSPP